MEVGNPPLASAKHAKRGDGDNAGSRGMAAHVGEQFDAKHGTGKLWHRDGYDTEYIKTSSSNNLTPEFEARKYERREDQTSPN